MNTVEDVQAALNTAIEETYADLGDEMDVDEGSVAADLFASMTYFDDFTPDVLAEAARREFGYVPFGSAQAVADAFNQIEGAGEF